MFVKHGEEVIGILDGHASANTEVDIAVRYTGASSPILKPYIPEPFLSIYSRLNRHDSVWRRIRSVYCSPPPHDLAYYSSETLKHGSNDFTACFDKCQLLIVQRAFTPLMYNPKSFAAARVNCQYYITGHSARNSGFFLVQSVSCVEQSPRSMHLPMFVLKCLFTNKHENNQWTNTYIPHLFTRA